MNRKLYRLEDTKTVQVWLINDWKHTTITYRHPAPCRLGTEELNNYDCDSPTALCIVE
jgi:hypothetical protein